MDAITCPRCHATNVDEAVPGSTRSIFRCLVCRDSFLVSWRASGREIGGPSADTSAAIDALTPSGRAR